MNREEIKASERPVPGKRRKYAIIIVCCLALIILLMIGVLKGRKRLTSAPQWTPRPVPVTTEPAKRMAIQETLSYLARLEPVATVEISPQVSAQVMDLFADDGDHVEAGFLLAKLDDRDIVSRIDSLKAGISAQEARIKGNSAALESARSNHSFLKREYERDQKLFQEKGISASALETSRNKLDVAVGKVRVLEEERESLSQDLNALSAQLEEARVRLGYTEIRSPVKGTIERCYVEKGDQANPGAPLYALMDRSLQRLAFELVQEDMVRVRPGQKVLIQWSAEAGSNGSTEKLSRIFPSLDTGKTVRAEVDLSATPPKDLKMSSLIPIRLVLSEETGLTVPRQAMVPMDDQAQGVYVVRSGRLELVRVETGILDETMILVRGDLKEGETVVVGEYLQWVRHHQGQPVEALK